MARKTMASLEAEIKQLKNEKESILQDAAKAQGKLQNLLQELSKILSTPSFTNQELGLMGVSSRAERDKELSPAEIFCLIGKLQERSAQLNTGHIVRGLEDAVREIFPSIPCNGWYRGS